MQLLKHSRTSTEITDDEQTIRYFIGFDKNANHSWFIEKYYDADVRYVDGVPEVDIEDAEMCGYVVERADGILYAMNDMGELQEPPVNPKSNYENLPDPE